MVQHKWDRFFAQAYKIQDLGRVEDLQSNDFPILAIIGYDVLTELLESTLALSEKKMYIASAATS